MCKTNYKFKGYVKSIEKEDKIKIRFDYIAIKGLKENVYLAISENKQSILELKEDDIFVCDDKFLNIILAGALSNNAFIITFESNGVNDNNSSTKMTYNITKVELNYD